MFRAIKVLQTITSVPRAAFLNAASSRLAKCGYVTRVLELQRQIEIEARKGRETIHLKENLCIAYIKEKNVEKIEELTKTCVFSEYVYRGIIDMYTGMGDTGHALCYFDEIRLNRPNFRLTQGEAARLALAMYKENREWSEIIRLLAQNKQQRSESRNVNDMNVLLQTVASAGNSAELVELLDVMAANNLLVKDNNVAGFMIKVHLVNNDLPSAVRAFERQFEERKFTSNKVPLMMALIVANDMEGLQKVFKCLLLKFSIGDSVLALVTSLLEIGNIKLARVLLTHFKSHITDQEFRRECRRYDDHNLHEMLQHLLTATAELEYDRSTIYSCLLAHFCAQRQTSQALELWRTHCGQNEEPSRDFLLALASYLTENGLSVPFDIRDPVKPLVPSHISLEAVKGANAAMKEGNVDAALKHWNKIDPNFAEYTSVSSRLVRFLSKSQANCKNAVDIVVRCMKLNRRVSDVALHDLIQRLSNHGETQLLERLGDMLPIPMKRSVQFSSEFVKAYTRTGNWDDFFSIALAKKRMNANINDRIPMGDLLTLLQNQSIPLSAFEKFAVAAADLGACQPLNVLWAHYFLIDSPESFKLYNRFEQYFPKKFDVAFLVGFLADAEDDDKLEKVRVFVRANCETQLPAINIISLISRTTRSCRPKK